MFTSYSICTDALLNITLALHSLQSFNVTPPCNTWQNVLKNSLGYQSTDGSFVDVISSGDFAAVSPPTLSDYAVGSTIDAALFLFMYFTVFVVYSKGIHDLP